MSSHEIQNLASEVAEIIFNRQQGRETPDMMTCASPGPAKQAINQKLIDEVVNNCQNAIIGNCGSDDEQFLAIAQLRERLSKYWDEQARTSNEVSSVNTNRAQALGKFIEMTMPH